MISGRLDGERPSVHGKEWDSNICLSCYSGFSVQFSLMHHILQSARCTQIQSSLVTMCTHWEPKSGGVCSCLSSGARVPLLDVQPQCNVGRCWLKISDLVRSPSSKGSNSGQKSFGIIGGKLLLIGTCNWSSISEDDILSGQILENGCNCISEIVEHKRLLCRQLC